MLSILRGRDRWQMQVSVSRCTINQTKHLRITGSTRCQSRAQPCSCKWEQPCFQFLYLNEIYTQHLNFVLSFFNVLFTLLVYKCVFHCIVACKENHMFFFHIRRCMSLLLMHSVAYVRTIERTMFLQLCKCTFLCMRIYVYIGLFCSLAPFRHF